MRTWSYTLGGTTLAVLAIAHLWIGAAKGNWFNVAVAFLCAVSGVFVLRRKEGV